MKPAPFDYCRPASLDEAVEALSSSDSAKVLAGGQSLIPSMNFRLSQPSLLVDIRRVEGLGALEAGPGGVSIGASVTQSRVASSSEVYAAAPGLRRALRFVGHLQIRNRGTVCGSLAHADPAAELPALAAACSARLTIRGPKGERTAEADGFYLGPYWADLEPSEIITEVRFPAEPPGSTTMIDEIARRSGDFAVAGLAAVFDAADGEVIGARLVSFGVSGRPGRLAAAEEAVRGFRAEADGEELYGAAFEDAADAVDDIHASSEYRREALGALAVRLARAAASNGGGKGV